LSTRPVEGNDHSELVRRAQDGSQAAFAELVRIHQHEVFALALRLVSNYDLAGDVAQESFVRAWRALPRFRGEAAFSTWLYRITVNTAWTLRSRWRRHAAVPLDEASSWSEDRGITPEEASENRELRDRLSGAVAALPEAQRAVVVLKDVYGWTHREVAKALGITVTATKVRLHRARLRLRDKLVGDES